LDYLGIRDYFEQDTIAFIEWPDKGQGWLAEADLLISLRFNQMGRIGKITTGTMNGKRLLDKLKQDL